MSDMVIATDDETQTAQVLGERGVAGKIFAHTVRKLHDSAHLSLLRHKDIVGDVGHTVGAFINILRTLDIHKHTSVRQKKSLLISYHKSGVLCIIFEQS